MPGLYGYVRLTDRGPAPRSALDTMLAEVSFPHPVSQSEYADDRVAALACRFGSGRKVAPRAANAAAVLLDGYLLDRPGLSRRARGADGVGEASGDGAADEGLAATLWGRFGEAVLAGLEGDFNLCVVPPAGGGVLLASCRLGTRHLYYAVTQDWAAFATHMAALAALPGAPRQVDRLALQEMFNFGYVGGCRTLLDGVRLLPGGSVLRLGGDGASLHPYWGLAFANTSSPGRFDDLVDEAIQGLAQAVGAHLERFPRPAVPLSGGLDSRSILAFAAARWADLPVYHCAWYPTEARIARQLAEACAARWHEYDPTAFDFARLLEEGTRFGEGNVHCHQYWFLPVARDLAAGGQVDVVLDGYLMDVFFGDTFLVLPGRLRADDGEKRRIVNRLWRRSHPAFVRRAFRPAFYAEYQEANRASIAEQIAAIDEPDLSHFVHRFSFANRSNRYSVALPNVQRQHVEYGYPGLWGPLVDLYCRIPPRHKVGAAFARAVVSRFAPHLAAVPWAKTGRPLTEGKGWTDRLVGRLSLRRVADLALLQVSRGRWDRRPPADLNRLFRRHPGFRRAHLDIAADERTLSRGFIDRRGLERLVAMVDAGWPAFFLLQSLVTVELFHRRFVDRG